MLDGVLLGRCVVRLPCLWIFPFPIKRRQDKVPCDDVTCFYPPLHAVAVMVPQGLLVIERLIVMICWAIFSGPS